MSNTIEIKRTNYAARQEFANDVMIPSLVVAGVPFSCLAAFGEHFCEILFIQVLVYQATLAAIWIGFRCINVWAQCFVVILLILEGGRGDGSQQGFGLLFLLSAVHCVPYLPGRVSLVRTSVGCLAKYRGDRWELRVDGSMASTRVLVACAGRAC